MHALAQGVDDGGGEVGGAGGECVGRQREDDGFFQFERRLGGEGLGDGRVVIGGMGVAGADCNGKPVDDR